MSWASARGESELVAALQGAGHAPPEKPVTLDELKRDARGQKQGVLEIFTSSVVTDGRHLKIRGRVTNLYPDTVEGVHIRVLLFSSDMQRELDRFHEELTVQLAPGESDALRVDIASMYAASEPRFVVEAEPVRLGGKEYTLPADW